jgi:hypothetical protein
MSDNEWELVVFADDLPVCLDCGEPYYTKHNMHYADCPCIGPTEDEQEVEYKTIEGNEYARRKVEGEA